LKSKLIRNIVILAGAGLLVLAAETSCKSKAGEAGAPSAKRQGPGAKGRVQFPVEIAQVDLRSLVYSISAVGGVDAFEKVQVTARVAGVVDRVLFAEGNRAALDQILVEIEPERYRLAVESAQATFDKASASQADAEAGLKRRETVIAQNPGLIPGEELETWRTKVRLAMADVAQTRSALNQAKLNLHDAYVRAPFAGIIQTRTVQTGQYVQVGTVLATLVRRDPLLLRFRVPERDAARLQPGMPAEFRVRENEKVYKATLTHVAAAADEGARMVDVSAEVKDSGDAALRPGAFAEITVPVSGGRPVPVIPQLAVRASERGFIAFVVENNAAVERIVTVGMRTLDGQIEILSGLNLGESLVVRGAEALQNGSPVRIAGAGGAPDKPQDKPQDKPREKPRKPR